jgi:hypothetical protein
MAPKTVNPWGCYPVVVSSPWAITSPDYDASLVMAVTRSGRKVTGSIENSELNVIFLYASVLE